MNYLQQPLTSKQATLTTACASRLHDIISTDSNHLKNEIWSHATASQTYFSASAAAKML